MRFMLLFAVLPLTAQIVVQPDGSVLATAGTLICTLTAPLVSCTVPLKSASGQDLGPTNYMILNTLLTSGVDCSGYVVRNGNVVNYTVSQAGSTISWQLTVQPNGGVIIRQSGVFTHLIGPVQVGVLVGGKCMPFGTGFHAVVDTMVANEVQGNCVLP